MREMIEIGLGRVVKRFLFVVVLLGFMALEGYLAGNALAAWTDSPLLHNSNRFSCSDPAYLDQATCTANGGTWNPDGKWTNGWGTDAAGAKYGPIVCSTCHTKNASNIKRVKATITAPNSPTDKFPIEAAGGTINFQSTSGVNSFGDDGRADITTSNLICEGCHSITSVHRYNSTGISDFNHKNANRTDCITCHPHKQGFKPLACDSCHGYPPTTLAGLVTGADATGSTAFGAHQKHAVTLGYACENCHNGYVMPNSGDIDIHFSNFGSTTGTYTGQVTATYNGVAGTGGLTCNSVYCHSSGQSADGASATPVYSAPTWTGSVGCGSCHANVPNTGSHASHVADATTECADCHTGAVEATTVPTTGHIDRVIDVNSGSYTKGGAPGNGYGTCTASCHNTGRNSGGLTDVWGTTLSNCSECHPTVPATAGHATHMGKNFKGVAIGCGDCHSGTTEGATAGSGHRDGNIDVAGYAATDKGLGTAYTNCTTASCHQNGLVSTTNYVATPNWDLDTANCTQCHAAVPATGSHAAHVTSAGKDCSVCHTGATKDTSYDSSAHGDLNIDVAVGGYAADKAIATAYTGCTNLACHSDGMAATGNAPTWGTDANCAACHLSNMTTGSHTKHLADNSNCGNCHDGAVKDSNPGTAHVDGNVDVTATYATANAAYGNTTWTTCSAASCHDDGRAPNVSPQWGTSPVNSCLSCHEAIPSTGSHASHTADATTECTDCHTGAVQETTAPTDGHRDGDIDVDSGGYPTNRAKTSAFTNCTTASCHNDGRNGGVTQNWGTTLNNCSECHATVPATGSHTDHMALYSCGTCHAGTTQGTTAGAGHRDGDIDVDTTTTGLATNKTLGSAFTSCGTSNCHGSNSPVWGTDLDSYDSCTQCHGQLVAAPATEAQKAPGGLGVDTNGDSAATDAQVGAHQIHLNPTKSKAVVCSACHQVPATITAAGHIDSALPAELVWGNLAVANSTSPTSCATTYCHDGSRIKNGATWDNGDTTPTWADTTFMSGVVEDCDNCHGFPPTGGHPVNADCSACHINTVAADNDFIDRSKHVNGILETEGGETCTDCHGAGMYKDPNTNHPDHAKHTDVAYFLAGKTLSAGDYGKAAASGTNSIGWFDVKYSASSTIIAGCGQCHPKDATTYHLKLGNNIDVAQDLTITAPNPKRNNTAGAVYGLGQCSGVYCHSDGIADGTYLTTPVWNSGTLTGCNTCHGNAPTTNGNIHGAHAVGIHYDTLYDDDAYGLMPAASTPATDAGAAHGNSATADVISCQTCHANTVSVNVNAGSSVCGSCHTAGDGKAGSTNATIKASSWAHLDGAVNVVFSNLTGFKSKAQLRDDITSVSELNDNWTRTNGYKGATGTSHDAGKALTPAYSEGTCSNVNCHNGLTTPAWSGGLNLNCSACHTSVPK